MTARGHSEAYEAVAARHNRLGVTDPVDPTLRRFHNRPFLVLRAKAVKRTSRPHPFFADNHPMPALDPGKVP